MNSSSGRVAIGLLGALTALASILPGCSTAQFDSTGQSSAAVSSQAQMALADLRARFVIKTQESKSPIDDQTKVAVTRPVFVTSTVDRFDSESTMLLPHSTDKPNKPATIKLATTSGNASHLEDSTGVAVDLKLEGLTDLAGATVDGYLVYPGAMAGGHYAVRASGDGLEDFVDLEVAPGGNEIVYDVTLGSKVAGLRLAGNALEFLDTTGTPRLHVAPPFLVESTGKRWDATLSVTGCKVDTSLSPPWGRATTAPGAPTCKVHIGWSSSISFPAVVDPSWTTTGSMIESRADHTGTLLNNGKTLVVGGLNASSACAGAELWDPATGTWASTGSPSTKRRFHTATLLSSGIVLIAGGMGSTGVLLGSAELYDPSSGAWTTTGSLADFPNAYATAHLLSNGNGIANGGFESGTLTGWTASGAATSVTTTTPHSGTYAAMLGLTTATNGDSNVSQTFTVPNQATSVSFWYKVTCPDTVQYDWATVTLVDNTPGGATTTPLPKICANSAWTQVSASVIAGRNYTLTLTNHDDNFASDPTYTLFDDLEFSTGKVLYIGGRDERPPAFGGRYYTPNTELYDPTAGSWSLTGAMATGRAFQASALLPNGKVLVTGGATTYGTSTATASAELYDPIAATWSNATSMATARYSHTLTTLAYNRKTFAAGGYASGTTTPLNSTEVYDVGANTWTAGPNMMTARAVHRAAVLGDSTLLIAGGYIDAINTMTATTDVYDQTARTLVAGTSMLRSTASFSITPAGDPTLVWPVLVAGGYGPAGPTASTSLYDLRPSGDARSSPVEDADPTLAVATWTNADPRGSYAPGATLGATVQNTSSSQQTIYVDLMATGLDGRRAVKSAYQQVTLAAGGSQNFNVTLSDLPIQSVGTESQIFLMARVSGTPDQLVPSNPIFAEFNSTYSTVTLHGAIGKDLDRTQPAQSTTQAQLISSLRAGLPNLHAAQGKVWTVGGGFVDVTTLPPVTSGSGTVGPGYFALGQWAVDIRALFPTLVPTTLDPSAPPQKLCSDFTAHYADEGYGEDYLVHDPLDVTKGVHEPAHFAAGILMQDWVGGGIAWSGFLDSAGCMPSLNLVAGNYVYIQFALLRSGGTTVEVNFGAYPSINYPPNSSTSLMEMAGFTLSSSASTVNIPLDWEDTETRVAAVLSRILSMTDNGLLSNWTYEADSDTGCPGQPFYNTEACYDPKTDHFYVGVTQSAPHIHLSKYKSIVAHEFGHNIHYKLVGAASDGTGSGTIYYDYSLAKPQYDTPSQPLCRCDYVSPYNKAHCLESRERQGTAGNEGFAHFVASRSFNNWGKSSCSYPYYKQINVNNGIYFQTYNPVQRVDCMNSPHWMEAQCASGEPTLGNEWDWLTFFYNVNTQTGNKFSMTDLASTYRMACSGSSSGVCAKDINFRGPVVYFNQTASTLTSIPFLSGGVSTTVQVGPGTYSLADAACRYISGSSGGLCANPFTSRFKYFRDTGISFGIDH